MMISLLQSYRLNYDEKSILAPPKTITTIEDRKELVIRNPDYQNCLSLNQFYLTNILFIWPSEVGMYLLGIRSAPDASQNL